MAPWHSAYSLLTAPIILCSQIQWFVCLSGCLLERLSVLEECPCSLCLSLVLRSGDSPLQSRKMSDLRRRGFEFLQVNDSHLGESRAVPPSPQLLRRASINPK